MRYINDPLSQGRNQKETADGVSDYYRQGRLIILHKVQTQPFSHHRCDER